MSSYDGFSIEQMLHYLGKYSSELHLTNIDDEWRICVTSAEYGTFEMNGSMMQVLIEAFKPIKDKVTADRNKNAKLLTQLDM